MSAGRPPRSTISLVILGLLLVAGVARAQEEEPEPAPPKDPITITLKCSQQGGPLTGVAEIHLKNGDGVLWDVVVGAEFDPSRMVYESDPLNGAVTGGRVTWPIDSLAAGEERRLRFRYRILSRARGELSVTAYVRSGGIAISDRYTIQTVGAEAEVRPEPPVQEPPPVKRSAVGLECGVTEGQGGNLQVAEVTADSAFYYLFTLRNRGTHQFNLRMIFELSSDVDLDGSRRPGIVDLPTSTQVTRPLRPELMAGGRYRFLFPSLLQPGETYYVLVPVKVGRTTLRTTASIRARIAWIAHDPDSGRDTGEFGEIVAEDATVVAGAQPMPPAPPPPPPEPVIPPAPPAVPYPILRTIVTTGQDGELDIASFPAGDPFYFLVTLENRTAPMLDVKAELQLSPGLALDTERPLGLVGTPGSTKVLLPIDVEDLGENRFRLVRGGGFWLLGKRTAYILVPVKAAGPTGETAETLGLDLTWKAHDPATKDYLDRRGEFTTSGAAWIREK